jgi:hypothetical protein
VTDNKVGCKLLNKTTHKQSKQQQQQQQQLGYGIK